MSHRIAGTHIEIDLTHRQVRKKECPSGLAHDYLGGRGIATRLFWERMSPETNALDARNILVFAIDLFQHGILTSADTGGMVLGWQQADTVLALINCMVRREGIGDLLADGVHAAAARIGRGAEARVVSLKRLEALPLHMDQPYQALRSAITDKPDPTSSESYFVSEALNASREWKTAFLVSGL